MQSSQQEDAAEFLCQTITEACLSVSGVPAVETHRWAGQVLTCPPAAPNYNRILLLVMLSE